MPLTGSGPDMCGLALRGGRYNDQHGAGLFGLYLNDNRADRGRVVGFRPAFIL